MLLVMVKLKLTSSVVTPTEVYIHGQVHCAKYIVQYIVKYIVQYIVQSTL